MTLEQHVALMESKFKSMVELTKAKSNDYNGKKNAEDVFSNFRMVEHLGVASAEQGILVRMSDKMSRIASLLSHPQMVKSESIQDTLMDLCVYSVILSNYLDGKKNNE